MYYAFVHTSRHDAQGFVTLRVWDILQEKLWFKTQTEVSKVTDRRTRGPTRTCCG